MSNLFTGLTFEHFCFERRGHSLHVVRILPYSQGHNLALTVFNVPHLLDSGQGYHVGVPSPHVLDSVFWIWGFGGRKGGLGWQRHLQYGGATASPPPPLPSPPPALEGFRVQGIGQRSRNALPRHLPSASTLRAKRFKLSQPGRLSQIYLDFV